MRNKRRTPALLYCTLGLVIGVAIAVGAALTAAAIAGVFNTRPGTWTARITPFERLPSLGFTVNVPGTLRLALSPLGQRILNGRTRATAIGTLALRRHDRTLVVVCSPCRLDDARLAGQPLTLPLELRLTPHDGDLNGHIDGVLTAEGVHADLSASLAPEMIEVAWSVPATEAVDVVRALASVVPEAQIAQISGSIAARGTLLLPSLHGRSSLQLDHLDVSGLGTDSLADSAFQQDCTDRDGAPKKIVNGPGSRFWIAMTDLGERLPAAVVAAEDEHFFEHPGYDSREIAASLALEPGNPSVVSTPPSTRGISTLTEQLARTLYTGNERSAVRKLRELLYAVEMEHTLGKQRILELYLNTANWGPGVCGVRTAARTYFGKSPARLTTLESAWLAASLLQPRRAYEREFLSGRADLVRTHHVLAQMHGVPSRERAQSARQSLVFAHAPRQTPLAPSASTAQER